MTVLPVGRSAKPRNSMTLDAMRRRKLKMTVATPTSQTLRYDVRPDTGSSVMLGREEPLQIGRMYEEIARGASYIESYTIRLNKTYPSYVGLPRQVSH